MMIVEDMRVTYFCTQCEKSLEVSNLNVEFPIEDAYKHIGMTQCVNCKGIGTVDPVHIKCELSDQFRIQYQYTLRCNLCNTCWNEKIIIGGKIGLVKAKRRIEGEAECMNATCASRSFSLIAYKRLD